MKTVGLRIWSSEKRDFGSAFRYRHSTGNFRKEYMSYIQGVIFFLLVVPLCGMLGTEILPNQTCTEIWNIKQSNLIIILNNGNKQVPPRFLSRQICNYKLRCTLNLCTYLNIAYCMLIASEHTYYIYWWNKWNENEYYIMEMLLDTILETLLDGDKTVISFHSKIIKKSFR